MRLSQKEYGYRNGEMLVTASSGANVQWMVGDQVGTPRIIADRTGSLSGIRRHDYMPFGEELFAGTGNRTAAGGYAADAVRQKFTEKERDTETGLDYFLARYYSSTQGRFTSVDPENYQAIRDIADPQSWNAYAYVNNNPLGRNDPNGKSFWDRLKNAFFYGYFVENDQIEKLEQERRDWLSQHYYERDAQGNWRPFDASKLSRQDVFDKYREVKYFDEQGKLHELSSEEIIQAWSNVSPALKGDPYHPDAVNDRVRPQYKANPAHDPKSPSFNPRKTPEPPDAASVYQSSVRAGMGKWYGKGADGKIYQFFSDNAGGAHFAGTVPKSKVPNEVLKLLGF